MSDDRPLKYNEPGYQSPAVEATQREIDAWKRHVKDCKDYNRLLWAGRIVAGATCALCIQAWLRGWSL